MFVQLSKNSFIRIYDDGKLGYITNQLTKYDRAYNETGADFLKELARQPRKIEDCVNHLLTIYQAEKEPLTRDFIEFVSKLASCKFVLLGESIEDLIDMDFSYSMDQPKTMINDFRQQSGEESDYETQKYLLKHDTITPRLTSMQVELTSRCNERCIHCYIPNMVKNKGVDMPLNTFKRVIDQFVALGGLNVTLSGGEALLNKNLPEMLRYCREKDLIITLLTNLALLKEELIPVIKEVNLSGIQVSLYSMNPEIHDTITTVKGSWNKTKSAIERLYHADIPLQISCPAMKANKNDFVEVAKYAASLRMKAHCDYNLIAQDNLDTGNLCNRLSLSETKELLEGIIKFNENYQELISTGTNEDDVALNDEELPDAAICGVGKNTICISATGDFFPCAGWESYVVGNFYKESLIDVWNKSEKILFLRSLRKKDFPKCMTCSAHDYCAPCLVTNFNESNGDMFKLSKHVCETAFLNKKLVEDWRKDRAINGNR